MTALFHRADVQTPKPGPRGFVRADRAWLAALLVLALALRLRVGINTTYLVHPDETFDYLEQGFRLAFGYGGLTWTYQVGLRNYLLPGLIAGVMRLATVFGSQPAVYLNAVAAVMCLCSLSVVVSAFVWGHRAAGRIGAIVTGFLAAVWFELIYFASPTLSETAAMDTLVLGVCLCDDQDGPVPVRRLWWGGALLGLACVFRIQIAPAVVVVGLWLLWRRGTPALWRLTAAGAVPVIAAGLLDWVTYRYPFQSFILNVWANLFAGVSAHFGTQPFYYYADLEAHYLGGVLAVLALLALIGARQRPLLMLVAAVIIGTHSALGHKEYRFLAPALPFTIILAGLGASRIIAWLTPQLDRPRQRAIVATALMLFAFASWAQAMEGPFRREWLRGSGEIAAARDIAARSDVCGIGAYGIDGSALAGVVRYHHDVPVYSVSRPAHFPLDAVSFNVVIARDDDLPPVAGTGFSLARCWANGYNEASFNTRAPHICVLVRPGACQPGAVNDPDPDHIPGWF